MNNGKRKLFTPFDLVAAAAVTALALAAWLVFGGTGGAAAKAVITVKGEIYETVDLTAVEESYEIDLPTSPAVVLLVEPGAVSFRSAGCRDKLCVKCGKLTKNGQTAVCLPAGVTVTVEGGGKKDLDAVVY